MGSLAKTPLTALIFAALLHFFTAFIPYSQGYSEVLAGFNMPLTGYAFMVAYGLWLSIIVALIFATARAGGIKLALLLAVPLFGSQWLVPAVQQLYYGETTGVMAKSDLLFNIARGCASGLFLLLLASMLFRKPPEPDTSKQSHQKPQDKFKIKKLDLAIKLLVLPVIYGVIYFLAWYFLLWRSEAARVYYSGSGESRRFVEELVNMLLTNTSQVPVSLVKGLAYSLILLPLLIQLAPKRIMFIATTIMLYAGSAVQMLIPSPVMPDAVRIAHLIEISAVSVVFGGLASFMLHTSMHKEDAKQPVATAPAKAGAKSGTKPAAAPAAAPKPEPAKK